ncbi:MAG: hypothetical protein F6J86_15500 [Symploca sp. SIO1B1]|nr:hypothetical protein [Symploca sp. SIO1B1]
MQATIRLTNLLDTIADLLPLTYDELTQMTSKQIRDKVAKPLGIPGCYRMKKAQLIQQSFQELENARAYLQTSEVEREQAKQALKQLKKNEDYQIPISEIATKTYNRLREIAQTQSNLTDMKEGINPIVASVALSEMREYEFSTVKSRRNQIKDALYQMVASEIPLLKETMEVLVNYFYSQLLSFQKEDSIQLSKNYRKAVKGKNRDKTPISIFQLVNDCHQTLQDLMEGEEPHWAKVSIAFALGTGRRMVEIHALGQFSVTGEYQLHFSGQAKTRGAEGAKEEYSIPTLFPAKQLLAALEYLEKEGRRIDGDEQKRSRLATNRAFGMALSRAMEKYQGINYKGLRAIYAECQWYLLPESTKIKTEKHSLYSDWLGHLDKEGKLDATFMSYMVYLITDIECIKN